MSVQAAESGQFKDVLPQDLPECHHDDQVRRPFLKLFKSAGHFHPFRLDHRNVQFQRGLFDRRRNDLLAPSGFPVRLCDHADDVMMQCERFEGRNRDLRGSHINDSKFFHILVFSV